MLSTSTHAGGNKCLCENIQSDKDAPIDWWTLSPTKASDDWSNQMSMSLNTIDRKRERNQLCAKNDYNAVSVSLITRLSSIFKIWFLKYIIGTFQFHYNCKIRTLPSFNSKIYWCARVRYLCCHGNNKVKSHVYRFLNYKKQWTRFENNEISVWQLWVILKEINSNYIRHICIAVDLGQEAILASQISFPNFHRLYKDPVKNKHRSHLFYRSVKLRIKPGRTKGFCWHIFASNSSN